jgi:hypothetical protein
VRARSPTIPRLGMLRTASPHSSATAATRVCMAAIACKAPEFAVEAMYVRKHLDEVDKRRRVEGKPILDPQTPKTKKRYGL